MAWKDVAGFRGLYRVSDTGEVASLPRTVSHARYGAQKLPGGPLVARTTPGGYLRVTLNKGGQYHDRAVHRLVADAFCERSPGDSLVRHLDGDKANNRADNLAWGTVSDNMTDRRDHGRDNAAKTHCRNGHPFDAGNTRIMKNGHRACRQCGRESQARYRRSKK